MVQDRDSSERRVAKIFSRMRHDGSQQYSHEPRGVRGGAKMVLERPEIEARHRLDVAPGILGRILAGIFTLCGLAALAPSADAQPTATLLAGSGAGFTGESVTVGVFVGCTAEIDAVTFGLAHDEAVISIGSALAGSAFSTVPDFIDIDIAPGGLTYGVIVSFPQMIRLAAITAHEVVSIEYAIDLTAVLPQSTPLSFVPSLGSPPIAIVVVSGVDELIPTTTDGVINVLGPDCNGNFVIDSSDISIGTSLDCDGNGVPDECAIAAGTDGDCDGDGVLDTCESDCNFDGYPDDCEIFAAPPLDCDGSGALDSCELALGLLTDCDANGVPDPCDLTAGASDCDGSGVPDSCEVGLPGADTNSDGVLDVCEVQFRRGDCNANGSVNIADPMVLLTFVFLDPGLVACASPCDGNADCNIDLLDAAFMLAFIFMGGAAPPPPFLACGVDLAACGHPCPAFDICP